MARIRTIKPEFCQSENVGRLSRDARLCFVQLWTFVDDEGRCRAAPRVLAGALFPYDDDAPALIEGWIKELEDQDCVFRYQASGAAYLQVKNWKKHQKIDRPSVSRLPPPPQFDEPSMDPIEDSAQPRLPLDAGPRTVDHGSGTVDVDQDPHSLRSHGSSRACEFDEFISVFPKATNQDAARRQLVAVMASGVPFAEILEGARRYRAASTEILPRYQKPPDKWLEDGCWKDGRRPSEVAPSKPSTTFVKSADKRLWRALSAKFRAEKGKSPPEKDGGWYFPNEWLSELHEAVS